MKNIKRALDKWNERVRFMRGGGIFAMFCLFLRFLLEIDRMRITTAYDTGDGKEVMLDSLVVARFTDFIFV